MYADDTVLIAEIPDLGLQTLLNSLYSFLNNWNLNTDETFWRLWSSEMEVDLEKTKNGSMMEIFGKLQNYQTPLCQGK